ncbi:thioesterase family protein [Marinococcus luteus]|uniref:thioesterase family protein n=1 Tax=Marinococcus luteus TaxID=1122204 RepID=UPI002ACC920B|nr:thioesterase family protein [Marinococcus luteus]MDZ5784192.1 thioesterase family protein [Marinococcus luteus]
MTDNHIVWNGRVEREWVDYNRHMNDAAYALVFSRALDALLEDAGLTARFIEREQYTVFTLETHLMYLAEAHQDQPLAVSAVILDQDAKRLHLWLEMQNDKNGTIATSEQMVMGMDQAAGRPAPFPETLQQGFAKVPVLSPKNWPAKAGRSIGIKRK